MINFVIGVFVGLFSFPLIYYFSPGIVAGFCQKRMLRINSRNKRMDLTDQQMDALLNSMHKCVDVHWMNSIAQRFHFELQKSYAAESWMRSVILRKLEFLKNSGYIRNMRVIDIAFGKEAPYIENIRVVGEEDVRHAVSEKYKDFCDVFDEQELRRQNEDFEKVLEHEIFRRFTGGVFDEEVEKTCSESGGSSMNRQYDCPSNYFEDEEGGRVFMKDSTAEVRDKEGGSKSKDFDKIKFFKEVFENLQILVGMRYEGGLKVSLYFELPKKITVNITVLINRLKGDVLIRIPSKNYNTRGEYCFLPNPNISMSVESGIVGETGKMYFRKSMSSLLENYVRRFLLNAITYPSWVTQYLPLVVPSIKDATHKIERITVENHHVQTSFLKEAILLYLSMDYGIVGVENGIVYRRSGCIINGNGRISCTHFQIPRIPPKVHDFTCRSTLFDGLTVQENKTMNQFYDWSIFFGIIPGFHKLEAKTVLGTHSSIIELIFGDTKYEYVRIVAGDALLFQRNAPDHSEFLAFKISEYSLYIYQYAITEQIRMDAKKINELKKVFYKSNQTPSRSPNMFSNFFGLDKKEMPHVLLGDDVEEGEIENPKEEDDGNTELIRIFEEVKQFLETSKYSSRKLYSKASPETIYSVLSQDEIRIMIFSEDCDVYAVVEEARDIRSIVVEYTRGSPRKHPPHHVQKDAENAEHKSEFVVHSYFEKEMIIDVRILPEMREVFVYKIIPMEENSRGYKTKIVLLYNEVVDLNFQGYFIEALQLRIRHDEYMAIVKTIQYETFPIEKRFKKEITAYKGAIYIEFYTDVQDDYTFSLYSARDKRVMHYIHKVISSKRARFVFPVVKEQDALVVSLTPKFNRNRCIHCKFFALPENFLTETLVDCNIGLSKNMKFSCSVMGNTDSVIFWERVCSDEIKGYIEDDRTKVIISKSGSMRTDNKEYRICYKNKREKKREIRVFSGISLRKMI